MLCPHWPNNNSSRRSIPRISNQVFQCPRVRNRRLPGLRPSSTSRLPLYRVHRDSTHVLPLTEQHFFSLTVKMVHHPTNMRLQFYGELHAEHGILTDCACAFSVTPYVQRLKPSRKRLRGTSLIDDRLSWNGICWHGTVNQHIPLPGRHFFNCDLCRHQAGSSGQSRQFLRIGSDSQLKAIDSLAKLFQPVTF